MQTLLPSDKFIYVRKKEWVLEGSSEPEARSE